MSITVQQIITDAKKLNSRLKEHGSAADSLITQSQNVFKQIDAMKQYSDEVEDLNNMARQRPHSALVAGMQRENRYLRELQQENRELKAALEECQNALELIMSKYRQQVTQLLELSRIDMSKIYNDQYLEGLRELLNISTSLPSKITQEETLEKPQ